MNALNRLALLAGGTLVAAAATGCSSSAKPAAGGAPRPPASTTTGTTSSATSSAATAPSSAPSAAPTTTAGGTSALSGGSAATPHAAPTGHPVCDNAKLNASIAPAVAGQKASVAVIAVKNVGPTCTTRPLPYVWISAGPDNNPAETRPLIPATDSGKQLIILSGTSLYAAIDLDPGSAANAVPGYTWLDVTANPTRDTSGKDVQDLKLPAPARVATAMLGIYATSPAAAIGQIQYASTPES